MRLANNAHSKIAKKGDEMNQQAILMRDFMAKFDNPTLKVMSEMTGIQLTRVHRILKGNEMKLREYLIIKNLLKDNSTSKKKSLDLIDFQRIFEECLIECSEETLLDIYDELNNKLEIIKIIKTPNHQPPKVLGIGA